MGQKKGKGGNYKKEMLLESGWKKHSKLEDSNWADAGNGSSGV